MNICVRELAHNKRLRKDLPPVIRNIDKKNQQKKGRARRISRQAKVDSRETTYSQRQPGTSQA